MGIIGRQGFKKTVISYFGVLIGLISTLYIYPLEETLYGVARFLISMAALLIPVLTFGTNSLVVRFFPVFRDKDTGHHGFLGFLFLITTVCFLILGSLMYIWRDAFYGILRSINMDVKVFSENVLETGILAFITALSIVTTLYISNFKRIVVPGIFNSVYLKIGLPILIILIYFHLILESHFKWGLILIQLLILLSLIVYTYKLGELYLKPNFSFISKKLLGRMSSYSFQGVFASLGSTVAFRIDTIMTASLLGFSSTGIFSIADNIAGIIASPYQSIKEISAPIIAQNLYDGDMEKVKKLYKSSSIALSIIGWGMLICTYVSLESIFSLSSKYDVLIQGKYVVLLLGLARVVDMSGGLNDHIISYSSIYKWNVLLILMLGVINISLNYYLIPRFGINGAAMATLISMSMYNISKFVFVWFRFRMQPFSMTHLAVIAVGAVAFLLGYTIPESGFALLDILSKSGTTALVFGGVVLYFNLSPDITSMVANLKNRIQRLI